LKRSFTLLFVFLLCAKIILSQSQNNYELTSINFDGNSHFSGSELKSIILSKETPFWGWKFLNSIYHKLGSPPVYFDSSNIKADLYSLKDYYDANGYFKSQFSYHYLIDTVHMEVTLIYSIKEGEPALFGKITVNGLKYVPDIISKQVLEKLDVDTTAKFSQTKIENEIATIPLFFWMNGYMNARYDSTVTLKDTVKNSANVVIYFFPGRRYKISGVNIVTKGEGKDYVSEKLIRDLIDISPEEYYDIEKIKNSQNRLSRTGLFSSLKLQGGKEK